MEGDSSPCLLVGVWIQASDLESPGGWMIPMMWWGRIWIGMIAILKVGMWGISIIDRVDAFEVWRAWHGLIWTLLLLLLLHHPHPIDLKMHNDPYQIYPNQSISLPSNDTQTSAWYCYYYYHCHQQYNDDDDDNDVAIPISNSKLLYLDQPIEIWWIWGMAHQSNRHRWWMVWWIVWIRCECVGGLVWERVDRESENKSRWLESMLLLMLLLWHSLDCEAVVVDLYLHSRGGNHDEIRRLSFALDKYCAVVGVVFVAHHYYLTPIAVSMLVVVVAVGAASKLLFQHCH